MPLFWSTERKMFLAFGSAILALGIVACISVWLTLTLLADLDTVAEENHFIAAQNDIVSRQNDILSDISHANALAAQMATYARLFAVNHDNSSYEEWEKSLNDFRAKLGEIDDATRDSPTQIQRMRHINELLTEKVRITTRNATSRQVEDAWGIVNGISQVRPLTDELIAMSVEERTLLGDKNKEASAKIAEASRKNDEARHAAAAALWTLGIAFALALLTIGGALVMILRDLKTRARAAEELERARQAAEAASVAKSAFLANMSHELRTPLTSIMGYVDLLMDFNAAASGRLEYLQTIRRSGEHLLTLINDILDVSKIEAGRMVVETVACSLIDILAEIESLMRSRGAEKGVSLAVEYASPIPLRVRTDPTRFRQILMNLVGNAVKFTDTGAVRVVVHCKENSGMGGRNRPPLRIVIEVIDTGVGISPEQQRLLFQPFSQADVTTTRRFGGTGLGLSISRRLAHLLDGDLSVRSELGHGSTFRLSLPIEAAPGAPMLAPGEIAPLAADAARHPESHARDLDLRVLLAEDGVENRDVIVLHLRRAGCHVTAVEDGQQAFDAACRAWRTDDPFDIVLLDMQMPVMDGYTAASRLRAQGYGGAIIALTAHAMKEDRERCLAVGCDEYVPKPVNVPALLNMMARFTGHITDASAQDRLMADPALRQLIRKFCASLPATLQILRDLAARGAHQDLAVAAHRLAGAGGAYGFQEITRRAKALEKAAHAGRPAEVQDALQQLAAAFPPAPPSPGVSNDVPPPHHPPEIP
jgi:signal transduction histidine kinase/AmiR/NasT family two-component response regulator